MTATEEAPATGGADLQYHAQDTVETGMTQEEEQATTEEQAEQAAAKKRDNDRSSLHSAFPRHVGYISTLFSLGNIALQIFSHLSTSATFLSSIPYERGSPGMGVGAPAENATGPHNNTNSSSASLCLQDRYGFDAWWEERGKDEFFQYAQTCGPNIIVDSSGASVFDCLRADYGYNSTEACLDCFLLPIQCVMSSCLGTCLAMGVESVECVGCLIENDCDGPFEECTGVSAGLEDWEPPSPEEGSGSNGGGGDGVRSRLLQDGQESGQESTQLYEVYSISFVDSIRDAANGGAWYLVVILVCLSGIWPYLKNVIMLIAWFVPMTSSRRSSMLQWLTRLAKWSLVDVFVIVVICTGVKIDQEVAGGFRFVLVGEPRVGIITFCLAALWDLSQGEWMRTKHFELMHQEQEHLGENAHHDKEALVSRACSPETSKSSLLDQVRYRDSSRGCSSFGKSLYAFVVATQIAFISAVIATLCITFTIDGFPESSSGQDQFQYTAVTVATSLLYNFGTVSPGGTTAFVGSVFMVVVYLAMCIILPLLCCLLMASSSFLHGGIINKNPRRLRRYFSTVDILGGFSCLDVWLLAFVLCAIEFNDLMAGALKEIAGDMCEESGLCISLSSTIEIGVYLSIPAVLMGWIVEASFTYMEAYFVHPSEMFAPWNWLFGLRLWTTPTAQCDEVPESALEQ